MKKTLVAALSAAALAVVLAAPGMVSAQGAAPVKVTPPESPVDLQQRVMENRDNYWNSVQQQHNAWHNTHETQAEAIERNAGVTQWSVEQQRAADIAAWQNQQNAWQNQLNIQHQTAQKMAINDLNLQEAIMKHRHEQQRIALQRQKAEVENNLAREQGDINNNIMRQQTNLQTGSAAIGNQNWAQRQAMLNNLAWRRSMMQRYTGGPYRPPAVDAGVPQAAPQQ